MPDKFYIQFSSELNDLLSREQLNLEGLIRAELDQAGVGAKTDWEKNPTSLKPDREVFLVILASGVTASLIGGAVVRVIDAIGRGRRLTMKEHQLAPALDGGGNVIRDRSGNPVYQKIDGPGQHLPVGETSVTRLEAGKLLQFEIASGSAAAKDASLPAC